MVKDAGTKIAEQKRKISRFINAMTDAEPAPSLSAATPTDVR